MISLGKHYFQWWKTESIPPKVRNKTSVSTSTTIIQHSSGSPSCSNQRRKRNKWIQIRKEVQLSLFADDKILYIENPKDSIRKLLALTSEFSKVAGYKNNTQKSFVFHILIMKNNKEKLRNQSHSPLPQKKIKYLWINLPKKMKELYTDNYKTLMKKNQRWHKQKKIDSMLLGKKNQYCENDYTTKPIYIFNEIPIKLPWHFLHN